MPFDGTVITLDQTAPNVFGDLPSEIDFDIEFVPLERLPEQKYVVRTDTDEAIGVVGSNFNAASHRDFFRDIQKMMVENIDPADLQDIDVHYKVSRGGAWALMDVRFNQVKIPITTSKRQVELGMRGVFWHGVDGSCSNNGVFGAIDFFCTNGLISGEYERVKRKNSRHFQLASFVEEVRESKDQFHEASLSWQRMANTPLTFDQGKDLLETLIPAERKAERMVNLFGEEVASRGENLFSLHAAFTNYASYADERNGFTFRNTGVDNEAERMFKREVEVTQWVSSPQFQALLAA